MPLMADLKKWLNQHRLRVRPKSPLGKAVGYLANQWAALQVYLTDRRVPIDNNMVENQMRPIRVGRKNWLFAGSDEGGERAAVIYTVLATCVAGAEPWAYLRDVLPELAWRGEDADVADLLPQVRMERKKTGGAGGGGVNVAAVRRAPGASLGRYGRRSRRLAAIAGDGAWRNAFARRSDQ